MNLKSNESISDEDIAKLRHLAFQNVRDNFSGFIEAFAPKLVADFKMGRHIDVISKKLQQVEQGDIKRLMVFLPPRSSKSLICSKLFPAWYLGRHPNHEILSVSHSDQLASDFGRSVRDVVNDQDYQSIFEDVKLRSDVRAAGKWQTNKNGVYVAAGVRTQIAGRGAHVALLDDVMSEEDAFSEAGRRYIKEWYPAGLRTRLMPNGSIVIINTRYHEDDICGWLLSNQSDDDNKSLNWEVIRIPAWVDDNSSKILNLPVGESYFPEWKPKEILQNDEAEIRRHNGSRYWESLYMQNPVPAEGGILKKSWFQIWEDKDPPQCDFVIQTMDTAFSTRTTADYSVIQTWGIFVTVEKDSEGVEHDVGNLILLGSVRGRFEYPELRSNAQDAFDEVNAEAQKSIAKTSVELEFYGGIVNDVSKSEEERVQALEELNRLGVITEDITLDQADALETLNERLELARENILLKAQAEAAASLLSQAFEAQITAQNSSLEDNITFFDLDVAVQRQEQIHTRAEFDESKF